MSTAFSTFLLIPWFKLEPFFLPLPFPIPLFGNHIPLQPFGILVAIGVLLGFRLGEEFAKRNGYSPVLVTDFGLHTVIAGFIGSPLLNSLLYSPGALLGFLGDLPNVVAHMPELVRSLWTHETVDLHVTNPFTGLSSYGGFFGAAVGVFIWKKRRKLPVMRVADSAIVGLVPGWFFGRMGCFVVHDHPGRISNFFLAVDDYHTGHPPYYPRHDLGLYEVIWAALVSALFYYWFRKKPVRASGFYLSISMMLYAPVRFALDFLRATEAEGGDVRYAGLTPGQYWSIFFFFLGAWVLRQVLSAGVQPLPKELIWPPADGSNSIESSAAALASGSYHASTDGSSEPSETKPEASDQAEPAAKRASKKKRR